MQRFSAASDSKMNEKSGGKLAVLLLFSELFALLFSNFDEFQKYFQKFLKFFRNVSQISEKI